MHRAWRARRSDADLLRRAAARLRNDPERARHVGLGCPEDAVAMAALLDLIAAELPHVNSPTRRTAVVSCGRLLRVKDAPRDVKPAGRPGRPDVQDDRSRMREMAVRALGVERLPEIDDHVRLVAASRDRAWRALLAVLARTFRELPRPLTAAWGLEPRTRSGDWDDPVIGSTIPGFEVAEIDPPRVLTLRGQHRFSRYEFRFTLEDAEPGRVELHARTSAEFPGMLGRTYRALVIGTGGHAVAVRRLLAEVARRAEQPR
jgi:hypothetical protein